MYYCWLMTSWRLEVQFVSLATETSPIPLSFLFLPQSYLSTTSYRLQSFSVPWKPHKSQPEEPAANRRFIHQNKENKVNIFMPFVFLSCAILQIWLEPEVHFLQKVHFFSHLLFSLFLFSINQSYSALLPLFAIFLTQVNILLSISLCFLFFVFLSSPLHSPF